MIELINLNNVGKTGMDHEFNIWSDKGCNNMSSSCLRKVLKEIALQLNFKGWKGMCSRLGRLHEQNDRHELGVFVKFAGPDLFSFTKEKKAPTQTLISKWLW